MVLWGRGVVLLWSKGMFWTGLIKPVRAKCLQGWKRSRCWTPKAGGKLIISNYRPLWVAAQVLIMCFCSIAALKKVLFQCFHMCSGHVEIWSPADVMCWLINLVLGFKSTPGPLQINRYLFCFLSNTHIHTTNCCPNGRFIIFGFLCVVMCSEYSSL